MIAADFISLVIPSLILVIFHLISTTLFTKQLKGFLYLGIIPFTIFLKPEAIVLILGSTIGIFLYNFIRKPSLKSLIPLLISLSITLFLLRETIDMHNILKYIPIINQQRGEHYILGARFGRLFHNKLSLSYYWLQNIEKHLSISTIFAKAKFPHISTYYPLAFLFPIDLILLTRKLTKISKPARDLLFSGAFVLFLLFLLGLDISTQINQVITYGLIYTLAIYLSNIYSQLNNKLYVLLTSFNVLYILLHTLNAPFFYNHL